MILAAVAPILYPTSSMVQYEPLDPNAPAGTSLRRYYEIDARMGSVVTTPPTGVGVMIKPAGSTGEVTAEVGGTNGIIPTISFQNSKYTRPVCGAIGIRMAPVAGAVTSSPWVNTGNSTLAGSIRYRRRSTWKGSEVWFSLRDATGALAWKGNNAVKLQAALQTQSAVEPTLVTLFTGFITAPEREKEGHRDLVVGCEAQDFVGARMPYHRMAYTRAYGGFKFTDAFQEIGEHVGFTASSIVVTGFADTVLPVHQVPGEPAFSWDKGDAPDLALDTLCKAVGAVWGIDASGNLFAKAIPTYTAGSYVYTIDSDTATASEACLHIRHKRDIEQFANSVLTVTGEEGWQQYGWALNTDSITNASAANFVGDYVWLVEEMQKAWWTATQIAAATLVKHLQFADTLFWQPVQAQPGIKPGDYVRAQIETAQITTNAIYLVVEEAGEFTLPAGNAQAWKQQFSMVRVA
jgi:hypothetical protein